MNTWKHACAMLMLTTLANGAYGEDETTQPPSDATASDRPERPNRQEMRRRMMERFDKDGDGQLSDEEREKAWETMRQFRRERGPEGRFGPPGEFGPPEGRRRGPDGPEGRGRGPGGPPPGDGPDGRRGPGGPGPFEPMAPERLFNAFDENNDDQLSRKEFGKLVERLREMRPPGGPGGPRGFHGRGGPDGPGAGPDDRPPRPWGERGEQGNPEFRRRRPPRDGDRGAADSNAEQPAADDATA